MQIPKVSVVMSAYNCGQYISEAIESILEQDFLNFELIIVDDGSTDDTLTKIIAYKDSRLVLLRNSRNLGLIKSLRKAYKESRGLYISKIDADDVALPGLIKKQVDLLNSNPDIGIVGTCFIDIDQAGNPLREVHYPRDNIYIQWAYLFGAAITHSGVMFRKDLLEKYSLDYREEFLHCEDYDLWSRLLKNCQGVNLDESLLKRRVWHGSVSKRYQETQIANHLKRSVLNFSEQFPRVHFTDAIVRNLLSIESKRTEWSAEDIGYDSFRLYVRLLFDFGAGYKKAKNIHHLMLAKLKHVSCKIEKLQDMLRILILILILSVKNFWFIPKCFKWVAGKAWRRVNR